MSLRPDLDNFLAVISEGREGMPISIEEAQQRTGIARPRVMKRFRLLQDEGHGFLKLGRHGHPTRFYFARDEQPVRKERMPIAAEVSGERVPRVDPAASVGNAPAELSEPMMVEHRYQLRHDLIVVVSLPGDLTEREAARLARFVETLPL